MAHKMKNIYPNINSALNDMASDTTKRIMEDGPAYGFFGARLYIYFDGSLGRLGERNSPFQPLWNISHITRVDTYRRR
jgi:hypothetical protein